MSDTILYLLMYAALIIGAPGCSGPARQDEQSLTRVPDFCGAPAEAATIDSADAVAVMLQQAKAMWVAELDALRAYQTLACGDCDLSGDVRGDFYASSTAVVGRIAGEYPRDARAQCAWGQVLFRRASLGEGVYDHAALAEAESVLTEALALPDRLGTRSQLERLLADVREVAAMSP